MNASFKPLVDACEPTPNFVVAGAGGGGFGIGGGALNVIAVGFGGMALKAMV